MKIIPPDLANFFVTSRIYSRAVLVYSLVANSLAPRTSSKSGGIRKYGFTIIEVLIAAAIISGAFIASSTITTTLLSRHDENSKSARSAFVGEEGMEVVRYLRDSSYVNNIATKTLSTPYYAVFSAGDWSLTTVAPDLIDGIFTRTIEFYGVYRSITGEIVTSGGTLDPDIRRIEVSTSWSGQSGTVTKKINSYVAKIF